MFRLGINRCFYKQPSLSFKTANVKRMLNYPSSKETMERFNYIAVKNMEVLQKCIAYCDSIQVNAFRPPTIFYLATHPQLKYDIQDLADFSTIISLAKQINDELTKYSSRIFYHLSQTKVFGSNNAVLTQEARDELFFMHEMINTLNIGKHIIVNLGYEYGSKTETLKRTRDQLLTFSRDVLDRIALANNLTYTVEDILPLCYEFKIPLMYNIHAHKNHKDSLSLSDVLKLLPGLWNIDEPIVRVATSEKENKPQNLANYINENDIPTELFRTEYDITIEVDVNYKNESVKRILPFINEQAKISPTYNAHRNSSNRKEHMDSIILQ